MSRRAGRPALVGALLVAALVSACRAPSDEPGSPGSMVAGAPDASAAEIQRLIEAAKLEPCPDTERVATVADGLPDLTLDCLGAGRPVTLSGLRGTPLVVNLWASWCPPCAQEMPYLNAVHRAAGDRVRFLGIDLLDRRAPGLAWAKDLKMTFPSVEDPDGVIRGKLQVPAPPVTVFVRPDGRIAQLHYGAFRSERELRDALAEHLEVQL